ncbi:MAG: hypothetical protein HN826_04125, partial [Methylococcales bacterium]|nr:hypothetical protein [Methylococcales bacterium]
TIAHAEITLDDKVGIRTSKYKYFRPTTTKDKEINLLKHELEQMEEMIITMGEDDTPETNTANPKKKGTEDDYSDLFGS